MTKHTEKAGPLPAGIIDHAKLEANARAGKEDIYDGAIIVPEDEKPVKPSAQDAAGEAEAADAKPAAHPARSTK